MRPFLAVFALHLLGIALLLWLGYYWLGTDESDARHLLLSALIPLLVIVGATALHGLALAHFSGLPLRAAAARSGRNLLPLVVLSLLALVLYGGIVWAAERFAGGAAYTLRSSATMALQKPVPPGLFRRILQVLFWILEWIAIPAVLLPLAAVIAVDGWGGWSWRWQRLTKRWLYWIEVGALLVCAIWLPLKLFFWVPHFASFSSQMASFMARAGLGYLLFVGGALVLDFLTSSGKPREIQPSTVASP
jgi:hypothetical protein